MATMRTQLTCREVSLERRSALTDFSSSGRSTRSKRRGSSPAHSIESFPEQIAKVRDPGHEMYVPIFLPDIAFHYIAVELRDKYRGLHGYTHEFVFHS